MKRKQDNRGMSLVELIAAFALLGMLLAAAAVMIEAATEVYYQSKSESVGLEISETLLAKIRGELAEAGGSRSGQARSEQGRSEQGKSGQAKSGQDESVSEQVIISGDGRLLEFTDAEGRHSALGLIGGELYKYYYGDEPEAVNLGLCEGADMGYSVSDLAFTLQDAASQNGCPVIKVELVLSSPKYGSYSASEYVQLYKYYGEKPETFVQSGQITKIDDKKLR